MINYKKFHEGKSKDQARSEIRSFEDLSDSAKVKALGEMRIYTKLVIRKHIATAKKIHKELTLHQRVNARNGFPDVVRSVRELHILLKDDKALIKSIRANMLEFTKEGEYITYMS